MARARVSRRVNRVRARGKRGGSEFRRDSKHAALRHGWSESVSEGHEGWDDYAPFYDWENARTLGRRDVPFWRGVALHNGGRVLELGSGTGRISLPLARAGVRVVGIDRSAPMLD